MDHACINDCKRRDTLPREGNPAIFAGSREHGGPLTGFRRWVDRRSLELAPESRQGLTPNGGEDEYAHGCAKIYDPRPEHLWTTMSRQAEGGRTENGAIAP
jgi:hypothetical protein